MCRYSCSAVSLSFSSFSSDSFALSFSLLDASASSAWNNPNENNYASIDEKRKRRKMIHTLAGSTTPCLDPPSPTASPPPSFGCMRKIDIMNKLCKQKQKKRVCEKSPRQISCHLWCHTAPRGCTFCTWNNRGRQTASNILVWLRPQLRDLDSWGLLCWQHFSVQLGRQKRWWLGPFWCCCCCDDCEMWEKFSIGR